MNSKGCPVAEEEVLGISNQLCISLDQAITPQEIADAAQQQIQGHAVRARGEENQHAGKRSRDEDGGFTGGDRTQTPSHESGPAMSTSAAVAGRCISSRHR